MASPEAQPVDTGQDVTSGEQTSNANSAWAANGLEMANEVYFRFYLLPFVLGTDVVWWA